MRFSTMFTVSLLVMACLAYGIGAPPVDAAEQPTPPQNPLPLQYLKKTVDFPHLPHTGLTCVSCHHTWDGESVMPKCTNSGCHDVMDPKDKSVQSFYKVIHGRGSKDVASCLSCHKVEAKKQPDKRKYLTGCTQSACHPN